MLAERTSDLLVELLLDQLQVRERHLYHSAVDRVEPGTAELLQDLRSQSPTSACGRMVCCNVLAHVCAFCGFPYW